MQVKGIPIYQGSKLSKNKSSQNAFAELCNDK